MKNLETLDFVANNKGWYDGDSNYAIPSDVIEITKSLIDYMILYFNDKWSLFATLNNAIQMKYDNEPYCIEIEVSQYYTRIAIYNILLEEVVREVDIPHNKLNGWYKIENILDRHCLDIVDEIGEYHEAISD